MVGFEPNQTRVADGAYQLTTHASVKEEQTSNIWIQ
jgi:hypothetical protein